MLFEGGKPLRKVGAENIVDELMAVSDAGLLMPPKSTWFEPKLRSGLFVRRLR